MSLRVLAIGGARALHESLQGELASEGGEVHVAGSIASAVETLTHEPFDASVLQLSGAGMDGLRLLQMLREASPAPLLVVTPSGELLEQVAQLELEATDYVVEPYGMPELLARLRALVRRVRQAPSRVELLSDGELQVYVRAREVRLAGQPVELTGIEFDLLVVLLRHAGQVVPREELLAKAGRGDVKVGERTVDVHISHLRRKLAFTQQGLNRIQAVRGVGYVLTHPG